VLAVIATGTAYFAYDQRNVAVSRELATKAIAQLSDDPDQSIRLALRATKVSQTTEAETALRESMKNAQWHILRHTGVVTHAAFSPDGRSVVTASWDHTARIFRCEVCGSIVELLELAKKRIGDSG